MKPVADVAASILDVLAQEEAKTPFYLLILDQVIANAKAYRTAWLDAFPRSRTFWSYKTNPLSEVGIGLRSVGYGAEVTNPSEWSWACEDGFSHAEIIVNGPTKPNGLISNALKNGALLQLDSLEDVTNVLAILAGREKGDIAPRIGLRLAHPLADGLVSRFGMSGDEADEAMRLLAKHRWPLESLHFHTPAHAFPAGRLEALCAHQDRVRRIRDEFPNLCLNLGGGDPAPKEGQTVHSDLAAHINQIHALLAALGFDPEQAKILLEPGRAIVESAGVLVSQVLARKRRGDDIYLICDARAECLRGHASKQSCEVSILQREATSTQDLGGAITVHLERYSGEPVETVTIYGAHCYESDLAITSKVPRDTDRGAALIFGDAGAYDIACAGVWSGPQPPIFVSRDGAPKLVQRRLHPQADADPITSSIAAKDNLFDGPLPQDLPFSFRKEVVEVFDDMINRSVPLHQELQELTSRLAVQLSPHAPILDLGCSTGTTLERIATLADAPLHLIGVDSSSDMLERADKKLMPQRARHRIDLHCGDITEFNYDELPVIGVAIMNLVAQFLRPLERERVISRVFSTLRPGGSFLFVEKTIDEAPSISALYIKEYHRKKISNGYSLDEVEQKRAALENRLIPFHPTENIKILKRAGFTHVTHYFTWLNFQGYLALKGESERDDD